MNKTFAFYILAVVMAMVSVRVYLGTSMAFAQTRTIAPQQGGIQRGELSQPTPAELMSAIKSLSAQVGELKQTVDSQSQTISQLRQMSGTEFQNVHDIAGRLGAVCNMVAITPASKGVQLSGYNLSNCFATGWGPSFLQQITKPFY